MNWLNICTAFSLVISTSLTIDTDFRCGDGWLAFDEEKCYKVVNRSLSKDEAINACGEGATYLSSIVTIKSKSEQKLLEDYLFNELGIHENVWIGAKRDQINYNQSFPFEWEDGSQILYQNWEKGRPSNDTDYNCVQMKANNGKWIDLACNRTGIVVCEKLQIWTFPELLNRFFEWRRHLEHREEELIEVLLKKELKIKELNQEVEKLSDRLSCSITDLDNLGHKFESRLNNTRDILVDKNKKSEKKITKLEKKADNIVDGMLALHNECSKGCNNGSTDSQLENIKQKIMKEIDGKLETIDDKLDNTVTDARLSIVSYRRTLQIKKNGQWINLGHV